MSATLQFTSQISACNELTILSHMRQADAGAGTGNEVGGLPRQRASNWQRGFQEMMCDYAQQCV